MAWARRVTSPEIFAAEVGYAQGLGGFIEGLEDVDAVDDKLAVVVDHSIDNPLWIHGIEEVAGLEEAGFDECDELAALCQENVVVEVFPILRHRMPIHLICQPLIALRAICNQFRPVIV